MVLFCVYVHVFTSLFSSKYTHVYQCAWRPEDNPSILLKVLSTVSHLPGNSWLGQTGWPASPKVPPISSSPGLGFQCHHFRISSDDLRWASTLGTPQEVIMSQVSDVSWGNITCSDHLSFYCLDLKKGPPSLTFSVAILLLTRISESEKT